MLTHEELVRRLLKDPKVRMEYEALAEEFAYLDEFLRARRRAGLSQSQVAKRMGTPTSAVARIESGGVAKRHLPSIAVLRQYASAVGCRLEIKLRPKKRKSSSI